MAGITKDIEINATCEQCFSVITDFEKYPEFLRDVITAKILDHGENWVECLYRVKVVKEFKYVLRLEWERPYTITWTYVRGDFKNNQGSWKLEPVDNGRKTRAYYTLDLDLGFWIPKAMVNTLTEGTLPAMLKAFKKRIEALYPST